LRTHPTTAAEIDLPPDLTVRRDIHNLMVMDIRRERTSAAPTAELDAVFGALADPIRRSILARLTQGEASVAELSAPFSVSQPAISRHLKVLERAGLILRSRRSTARLSHLRAEPLREATVWLAGYRDFWEESYERLDELLVSLQDERTDRSQAGDPTGRSTS
jgi:DNA-binding transcriptional ArsR family regulator